MRCILDIPQMNITKHLSILRLSILLQQGCGAFNNLEGEWDYILSVSFHLMSIVKAKLNRVKFKSSFFLNNVSDGCAMIDNWDAEEPHMKNRGNPLCRKLFGKGQDISKEPDPYPFKRVFRNEEYCVLKV